MADLIPYDCVVIGSGPAGYHAGIRARQLGLSACVIERGSPGGVCLNEGCIPTKNLLHQAGIFLGRSELERMGVRTDPAGFDFAPVAEQARAAARTLSDGVIYLLKKNDVPLLKATARIASPTDVVLDDGTVVKGRSIIIATGSRPRVFPGCPFDGTTVLSSSEALALDTLPSSIAILGCGYVGCEFAFIFNAFGVDVTLIEMEPRILPGMDHETVRVLARSFRRSGIRVMHTTRARTIEKHDGQVKITVEGPRSTEDLFAEKALVVVGRIPNSEGLGIGDIGIETDNGYIVTGDYYRTSVDGIYAVGDVIATPALAHVASKEAEIAVEHIAGKSPAPRIDNREIPSAVFTDPELGCFGLTEDNAREQGIAFKKAVFPYKGCGAAIATGNRDGLVKVLYDPDDKRILGAHAAGSGAAVIIHEILLAATSGISPSTVASMIHIHPSMAEAVMEVMRAVEGRSIHM